MGGDVSLTLGTLGEHKNQMEECSNEVSQWLVGRLLAGVQNAVSRNHILIMPSDIFICFFSNLFPSPSHGAPDLIFWMLKERS